MARTVIRFDLRGPGRDRGATRRAHTAAVEMAAWADRVGLGTIMLSEHHGAGDGYLPSPLVLAAAMAARTTHIPLTVAGLIVPLHDPLRLAEDLAVLDLVSNGRVSVVAEIGDRPSEYWMFGQDWNRRHERFDHCLETMVRAWTGESFEHNGDWVQVTPRPAQDPHPLVFLGGTGPAVAQRAARFGLGLYPSVADPDLVRIYRQECARLGRRPGFVIRPPSREVVFVTDDPERAWAELDEYLRFDEQATRRWLTHDVRQANAESVGATDDRRAGGPYRIVTADECVALAAGPDATLTLHPLCGGIPPELAWPGLELFASHVLPRIR